MNTSISNSSFNPSWLDTLAKSLMLKLAVYLEEGRIVLYENGKELIHVGETNNDLPCVRLYVDHPAFYRKLIFSGDIGAAEAYMRGWWRCDNLYELIRIIARNSRLYSRLGESWSLISYPINRLHAWFHRNTRFGSRKNIEAHYDLGNDFFSKFLDDTLCYSCGIFERDHATLFEASEAKMGRICKMIDLKPTDRVLEIGSGWGGFALYAARNYGCNVVATTISRAQYELSCQRIRNTGLTDKVQVLLKDYRDLTGIFDKIVSIEMIEAVGHQYLKDYFKKCAALLTQKGKMALQAITIRDQEYEIYRKGVDFIRHYIFPGGCLPSLSAICTITATHTDLRISHVEDISQHYVRTLLEWHRRFKENISSLRSMGYGESFLRLWELYLLACAGAFAEGKISDYQITLCKPEALRLT